ncbi:MAG: hypothetical protein ACLFUH_01200 [Bacteroidales bacterium]
MNKKIVIIGLILIAVVCTGVVLAFDFETLESNSFSDSWEDAYNIEFNDKYIVVALRDSNSAHHIKAFNRTTQEEIFTIEPGEKTDSIFDITGDTLAYYYDHEDIQLIDLETGDKIKRVGTEHSVQDFEFIDENTLGYHQSYNDNKLVLYNISTMEKENETTFSGKDVNNVIFKEDAIVVNIDRTMDPNIFRIYDRHTLEKTDEFYNSDDDPEIRYLYDFSFEDDKERYLVGNFNEDLFVVNENLETVLGLDNKPQLSSDAIIENGYVYMSNNEVIRENISNGNVDTSSINKDHISFYNYGSEMGGADDDEYKIYDTGVMPPKKTIKNSDVLTIETLSDISHDSENPYSITYNGEDITNNENTSIESLNTTLMSVDTDNNSIVSTENTSLSGNATIKASYLDTDTNEQHETTYNVTLGEYYSINETANLSIRINPYMSPNSSQNYDVKYGDDVVTGDNNTTVYSENTTLFTVNESLASITSTNESIAGKTNITAEYKYNGSTYKASKEIVVANLSVKNIKILPPFQKVISIIGNEGDGVAEGGNIHFFYLFTLLITGSAIGNYFGPFAGMGAIELGIIAGHVFDYTSLGLVIVGFVLMIFIMLNRRQQISISR